MSDVFAEVERDTIDAFTQEILEILGGCPIPRYGLCVITHMMRSSWIYPQPKNSPAAVMKLS